MEIEDLHVVSDVFDTGVECSCHLAKPSQDRPHSAHSKLQRAFIPVGGALTLA
jgi:hypothetical protein